MRNRFFGQRPLLTLPQILVLLSIVAGLFIAVDLNRRAEAGRMVGVGEEDLQAAVDAQSTRQVALEATAEYVQSESFVESYARNEGNYIRPGERRVVPMILEGTTQPTPAAAPTADPAVQALPWQAWWQLLTDAPQPVP
ncbi:MAG TPA: hypothetical protein VE553_11080 [Candidatus Binatia bacterium]|nr:hypothetical protein [Candidatus Binatia bacterium]